MDFPHPIEEAIALASLTTLDVGGPARYLARCGNARELVDTLAVARDRGLAIFLLGGGSNLLVADQGFDGLVVRITDETLTFESAADKVLVRAGAGVAWDRLVERTVAEGLGGLECLS
ncbi:MAG: FAD-binding protein, partial [bacterium]|nr:FAD-binding protein [bacterium]